MKLNQDQFAERFMQEFPDQKEKALEDIAFFGEVLGHVFYTNMLFHELDFCELLRTGQNPELIRKYCRFIESMWQEGDEAVQNIVCVSILEQLCCEEKIWFTFGKYISNDFIRFINTDAIPNHCLMTAVPHLPYHKRKNKPEKY